MNRIFQGARFDIKAINLNKFYSAVSKELGLDKKSSLEMGVQERTHHKDRTRTVTTTQIAAGHEFGNSFVQPRPFLRTSANEFVNGSFQEDVKQDYVYLGAFLKRLAKKLYSTVIECFLSGGFGQWLPLKESYMKRTGRVDPPLLDTGALMGSVYVKYEGYTITGKHTGGTLVTNTIIWDESDKSQGLTKKRIIDLNKSKEKKIKEKQKAKVIAAQKIREPIPEEKEYDPVIMVNKESKKRVKSAVAAALERIRKARGK